MKFNDRQGFLHDFRAHPLYTGTGDCPYKTKARTPATAAIAEKIPLEARVAAPWNIMP